MAYFQFLLEEGMLLVTDTEDEQDTSNEILLLTDQVKEEDSFPPVIHISSSWSSSTQEGGIIKNQLRLFLVGFSAGWREDTLREFPQVLDQQGSDNMPHFFLLHTKRAERNSRIKWPENKSSGFYRRSENKNVIRRNANIMINNITEIIHLTARQVNSVMDTIMMR